MASLREDVVKHHGCLICAGTSRAMYCGPYATSRFFREGWTAVGNAAQQRAEVLSRLDAQLAAKLAAQRTSLLAHQLPDTLRSAQMHHIKALEGLAKQQRLRLRGLLEVLPLKLVATRQWPAAFTSASSDGDAEELGTALGYLVRFLDLLAYYQGAPLLHQTDYQGSTPSIWMGRSFWDPGPGRALHRLHLSPEQVASFGGSAAPPAQWSGLQRTTSALSTLSSHAVMLWNGEAPHGRGQANSDLLRGLHLLHRSVATFVASKLGPTPELPESPIAALAGLVARLLHDRGSNKRSNAPPGHMSMSASLSDITAFSGQGFLMEASAMLNGGSDADNVDEWDFIQLPAAWQAVVIHRWQLPQALRNTDMQVTGTPLMLYGRNEAGKRHFRTDLSPERGEVQAWNDQLAVQLNGAGQGPSKAYTAAVEEVLLVEAGLQSATAGLEGSETGGEGATGPACTSCGNPLSAGETLQQVATEGRCASCQGLKEAGYFCSVCGKAFQPSASRSVASCGSCSRWAHAACDPAAGQSTYHCAACRKKSDTAKKLAMLRESEAAVQRAQPKKPRSAYQLFSEEILRQYEQDETLNIDSTDMPRVVGETWRALTLAERGPYEEVALQDSHRYQTEKTMFEELQRRYAELQQQARQAGLLEGELLQQSAVLALQPDALPPEPKQDRPKQPKQRKSAQASMPVTHRFVVSCNSIRGTLLLGPQRVICECADCRRRPEADREFSCTQFEAHCGAGAAKKWKASFKIEPGQLDEVPLGAPPMQVGKWLDIMGIELRPPARPSAAKAAGVSSASHSHSHGHGHGHGHAMVKAKAHRAPWNEMGAGMHTPIKVQWAGDRCSVCDSDIDYDFDQLVSCDMCGITVHQSCYGVPELPGQEDMWMCRACELKEEGTQPQCCLCPVEGGALKPTTIPGLWCHAACMQWIPEVAVEDVSKMEPVTHIKNIQRERWELLCTICRQRVGAKIQCSTCYVAYHPLCARMAGLRMEIQERQDAAGGVRLISYCPRHCTPKPEQSGVQLVREGDQAGEKEEENIHGGVQNGQLFPPLPAVPLPECSAGCARAQPLEGWERVSHGTGSGYSTVKGFWIPGKPEPKSYQPPLPEAVDEAPAVSAAFQAAGVGQVEAGVPAPGAGPAKVLGDPSSATAAATAAARPPRAPREQTFVMPMLLPQQPVEPQPVPLSPLPEGVPEQLDVVCNGRQAQLIVRSQRVLFGGQEISASRFEQLCGKGDAKKWKTSVWKTDEEGDADIMMQDWLNHYKLDRKTLSAFAANAAAASNYEEWTLEQASRAVEDIVAKLVKEAGEEELVWDAPQQEVSKVAVADSSAPQSSLLPLLPLAPMTTRGGTRVRQEPGREASGPGRAANSAGSTRGDDGDTEGLKVRLRRPKRPAPEPDDKAADFTGRRPTADAAGTQADSQVVKKPKPEQKSAPKPYQPPFGLDEPDKAVGARCKLFWPDDNEWYEGVIRAYSWDMGKHNVWYFYDEQGEWVDLRREKRAGRLQWVPANAPWNVARLSAAEAARAHRQASSGSLGKPRFGMDAVQLRIGVWWKDDGCYYFGRVARFNAAEGKHLVEYDDGEKEWLDLPAELVDWTAGSGAAAAAGGDALPNGSVSGGATAGPQASRPHQQQQQEALQPPAAGADADLPPPTEGYGAEAPPEPQLQPDLPSLVPVVCNNNRAALDVRRMAIVLPSGRDVTPTEFERMCGKGASKKWKASLRIDKGGGMPGMTAGDWLVSVGLDTAKAVRPKATTLNDVRRKQGRQTVPGSRTHLQRGLGGIKQVHREGCMCIICKQARRAGKPWGGMVEADGLAWQPPPPGAATGKAAGGRMVLPRYGKRAFLYCTPHAVAGLRRHTLWQVPRSTSNDPQQWLEAAAGPPPGGARTSTPAPVEQPLELPAPPAVPAVKAEPVDAGQAGPQKPQAAPNGTASVKAEPGTQQDGPAAAASSNGSGPPGRGRKGKGRLPVVKLKAGKGSAKSNGSSSGSAVADAAAAGDSSADIKPPVPPPPGSKASLGAGAAGPAAGTGLPSAVTAEPAVKTEPAGGATGAGPGPSKVLMVVPERKGMSLKERVQQCEAMEKYRIVFGKSGIHGWGLMAKTEIKQDTMVIEYRGDLVRSCLADLRQAHYNRTGRDCYLFNVNNADVVDATMRGTIARFTNHCCAPCLYTKIVEVDGMSRLVFFARATIRPGQELTYDYRFKEEDTDNKVPCACGAPNCRGTLN
eukprot:jgi/Astpho2/2152/fgenesh1_pg.00040_%23_10_t